MPPAACPATSTTNSTEHGATAAATAPNAERCHTSRRATAWPPPGHDALAISKRYADGGFTARERGSSDAESCAEPNASSWDGAATLATPTSNKDGELVPRAMSNPMARTPAVAQAINNPTASRQRSNRVLEGTSERN